MRHKVAKRKTRSVAAGHEPAFREIIGPITAARRRTFQAVNTELICFYWRVASPKASSLVAQFSKVAPLVRQLR